MNRATDGAHMINSGSGTMEEYIVPLCHSCNEIENELLTLKNGTKLVRANQKKVNAR